LHPDGPLNIDDDASPKGAECGRCARTIKTIIDETLGPCAKSCCSGCPHSHTVAANDETAELPRFALAAC
jgi:hypothetical protein